MSPITLHIAVGSYLKFEVTHNYVPGRDNCHWKLLQFNGPAEPMPLALYGGSEVGEVICTHVLNEMKHYAPSNQDRCNQYVIVRLKNGEDIGYEGLLTLPIANDGTIFNTCAIQDRFKSIFDLFSYAIVRGPL